MDMHLFSTKYNRPEVKNKTVKTLWLGRYKYNNPKRSIIYGNEVS